MPFDVNTAKTVNGTGFNLDTAKPVDTPSVYQRNYDVNGDNEIIAAPSYLNTQEVKYLDNIQNKKKSDGSFFGFKDIGNPLDLGKGYVRGIIQGGQSIYMLGLEQEERRLQRIEQIQSGEREYGIVDWLFESGTPIWEKKEPREIRYQKEAEKLRKSIAEKRQGIKDMPKVLQAMGLESDTLAADVGQGVQSLMQSIGVAMVTKDPKAAALFFGVQQKSNDYVQAREAGLSIEEASKVSYATSSAVGLIELIGVNSFFKVIDEGSVIKRGLKGFLVNATEEGSQEFAEILIKNNYDVTNIDFETGFGQVLYAGVVGGIVGAPVAASVKSDFAAQNNITLEEVNKLIEIGKSISDNASVQSLVEEELNTVIDEEFSGVKEDTASKQEIVEQIANSYVSGQEIDLSSFTEQEQEIIKKQLSEVEKGLLEIDAQEGRGFMPVPARPKTLSKFLKEQGGIKDDTAEAKRFRRKESPALKGVASKNGKLTLEQARELAVEAGYIQETAYEDGEQITDYRDLLDLLEQESMGVDVVADADMGALQYREEILAYNEQLDQAYAEILDTVNQVKSFRAAFKKGMRAARKDVKTAQEALIELLDKSGIEAKDKAKFIRTIKNIQTLEQLNKKAPDIQERVEKMLNETALGKQKQILKKSLSSKAIKPIVQSGRKKGKFGADVQERLERLRSASKLKADEAAERLGANLEGDAQDDLENKILSVLANPESATATDYAIINAEVKMLKLRGKTLNDAIKQNRAQYYTDLINGVDEYLDPNADVLSQKQAGVVKGLQQKFTGYVRETVGSYNDFIDTIIPPALRDDFRIGQEISQQKKIIRVMTERISKAASDIYGKSGRDLEYVLEGSHEIQDLGDFTDMNGDLVKLEVSIAQARKFWMEYQDTKLREKTIHNENGNAYTQEMADAILSMLTQKDIAFAKEQLKLYQEFYNEINKVYSDIYGINLPKSEFYSPIRRESDQDIKQGLDEFNAEMAFRVEVATGTATKLRDSKASSALKKQSDIAVYNKHIIEMSRFIALARKTRTLNNVFKNPRLRKKIKAKYGDKFDTNFHDILEIIARGSPVQTDMLNNIFNYLNRNFSTAVLGLKAKIGVTQLSSYFAYAEFISTNQFIDGTRDFFVNYKTAVKTLSQSELLRDRGATPDVDIARMGQALDSFKLKRIQNKKENLIDYALIFTKMGDRAAIYVGGWPVYKAAIDAGKTPQQAMAEFEAATAKTQQSKDIDQLSMMQMGNALGRSLGMFQSAPFAQFRGEMRAIRKFRNGEISAREFGKMMMIYHVLIPQMYKLLSNGLVFGEFNPEDQLYTFVFGSLNSIPLISEAINIASRSLQDKPIAGGGVIKWAGDLTGLGADVLLGMQDAITDGDFDAAIEVLPEFIGTTGQLVGLPTPQLEQMWDGLTDVSEGDTKSGAMKMFGYPDSVAEGDDSGDWKL